MRTAYRNSPRSVVLTLAAVRTDRDTARSVRKRSTWTEEIEEIGSLPKAGTMCTRKWDSTVSRCDLDRPSTSS